MVYTIKLFTSNIKLVTLIKKVCVYNKEERNKTVYRYVIQFQTAIENCVF